MASKLLTGISIATMAAINFAAASTTLTSPTHQQDIKTDTHKTIHNKDACPGKNCCAPKSNADDKTKLKKNSQK